jgi:hypothetical protein
MSHLDPEAFQRLQQAVMDQHTLPEATIITSRGVKKRYEAFIARQRELQAVLAQTPSWRRVRIYHLKRQLGYARLRAAGLRRSANLYDRLRWRYVDFKHRNDPDWIV